MQHTEAKIALLIDADNVSASKIDAILSEIAKYGVANIRRAYGIAVTTLVRTLLVPRAAGDQQRPCPN